VGPATTGRPHAAPPTTGNGARPPGRGAPEYPPVVTALSTAACLHSGASCWCNRPMPPIPRRAASAGAAGTRWGTAKRAGGSFASSPASGGHPSRGRATARCRAPRPGRNRVTGDDRRPTRRLPGHARPADHVLDEVYGRTVDTGPRTHRPRAVGTGGSARQAGSRWGEEKRAARRVGVTTSTRPRRRPYHDAAGVLERP